MQPRLVLGKLAEAEVPTSPQEIDDLSEAFAVHCAGTLSSLIMEYAVLHRQTEVFGLLLGEVVRTPSGRLRTIIKDFISAENLESSTATFVEVSAEELIRMDRRCEPLMQEKGLLKVGWFHTHPGHGIFMSGTDRDNHAMYTKPWQVALVLDPFKRTFGFFSGRNCDPTRHIDGSPERHVEEPSNRHGAGHSESEAKQRTSGKPRHWLFFLALIYQLALGYYAVLAQERASEAIDRISKTEATINRLEDEVESLRSRQEIRGNDADAK